MFTEKAHAHIAHLQSTQANATTKNCKRVCLVSAEQYCRNLTRTGQVLKSWILQEKLFSNLSVWSEASDTKLARMGPYGW